VRAVDGAGAGAMPRYLRPYLPAAGSTLKSSGAAGDYRKIRELLVGGLADVLTCWCWQWRRKMAKDGVEREGGDKWTSKEPGEAREVACAVRCMRQHGHSLA
jgi:hypothetical protein